MSADNMNSKCFTVCMKAKNGENKQTKIKTIPMISKEIHLDELVRNSLDVTVLL